MSTLTSSSSRTHLTIINHDDEGLDTQHKRQEAQIHALCMLNEGYATAYGELKEAEAFYELHKRKSVDPLFYGARDRLRSAKNRFESVGYGPTKTAELQVRRKEYAAKETSTLLSLKIPAPARVEALVKDIIKQERAYRHSLDTGTGTSAMFGIAGFGGKSIALNAWQRDIFTHRHSIYRAMLSTLVREGPAGMWTAWHDWGKEAVESVGLDGADLHHLCTDSSHDFIEVPHPRGATNTSRPNGYWETTEYYAVPVPPSAPAAATPVDRRRAFDERKRIAEGRPKRGRGRPVAVKFHDADEDAPLLIPEDDGIDLEAC